MRKTFTAGGLAVGGTIFGLSGLVPAEYCAALVVMGVMFFAVGASNVWAITQTLAGPQAAGRWTGFQNLVGNLPGVVAPVITGFVLGHTGKFNFALMIVAAVAWLGFMSWVFLVGKVEQVKWHAKLDVRPSNP